MNSYLARNNCEHPLGMVIQISSFVQELNDYPMFLLHIQIYATPEIKELC